MNEIEEKPRGYRLWIVLAVLVVLAGYAVFYLMSRSSAPVPAPANNGQAQENTAGKATQKQKLYMCPMNDIKPRPEPGSCPVCGMTLVPAP